MLTIFVRSYVEFTDLLQDHATERKRQLLQSLRHLRRVVAGGKVTAALLGGDLNIRDEEAKDYGATGGGMVVDHVGLKWRDSWNILR